MRLGSGSIPASVPVAVLQNPIINETDKSLEPADR